MKAIQTEYKGYKFRSRLEARWAIFFDELGIEWVYEPEGFVFENGMAYLPDFYLPQTDSFFEVKGIMSDKDMEKISRLVAESGKAVHIGYADFTFRACNIQVDDKISSKKHSHLIWCNYCRHYVFQGFNCDDDHCACPCCHAVEGQQKDVYDFSRGVGGDWIPNIDEEDQDFFDKQLFVAVMKARKARFEFGGR